MPELEGVTGYIITRMLEILFIDTDVKIALCKPYKQPGSNVPDIGTIKRQISETNRKHKQKPKNIKDAVIVRMKDTSYADLLKTVKSEVKPSEVEVEIKEMKCTRNGDNFLL